MTDFTANQATTTRVAPTASIFARLGSALWNGLVYLSENNSRAKALRKLSEMSDAELAALGTNRADAARRILSDIYYV